MQFGRFTVDLLPFGTKNGREVVAYKIYDEDSNPERDDPLLQGIAYRDEVTGVVSGQLRLMVDTLTGSNSIAVDMNKTRGTVQ